MFDDIFIRKTFNTKKALLFGFKKDKHNYKYKTDILDGMFNIQVIISSDGSVDTILTDDDIFLFFQYI